MASTKEQRVIKGTTPRTASKTRARAGRLNTMRSRGFEAKKIALVSAGLVVLLVLSLTGYALFQRFSANASSSVSTAGYSYLGNDSYFKYYMCRSGYTDARAVVVSEVGEANYSFNAQLASMGSVTDVGNIKSSGSYATKSSAWNIGNALQLTMSGLDAGAYMRIVGFYSPTSGNLSENGNFNSVGIVLRNLRSC